MAMNVVAFRHTICDGLGSLAGALEKAGADYTYLDTYYQDIADFDALAPDLLIVLGGAPGVYQAALYPFISDEIKAIEKRLAAGLPVLGICLGAQMMAKALGANVYVGEPGPEKGWFPLTVNEAGKNTPVRHLDGSQTSMLHWHGDTFDLPQGATLLASSAQYKNQVYSWGDHGLGLQCHAEVTPTILKSWMVNAAGDVAEGRLDLEKLRRETETHAPGLMTQAERFLLEWLAGLNREKAVA